MRGDARSGRVAVVPDALVNPPDGDTSTVDALVEDGWGLVVLPPAGLEADDLRAAVAVIADQLQAFARAGYELATTAPAGEVAALVERAGTPLARLDGGQPSAGTPARRSPAG